MTDPDDATAGLVKVVVELIHETVCHRHSETGCRVQREQVARRVL
jgi:hypothetical protein